MGRPFSIPDPIPLSEQQGQSFPRLVALMQRLLAPDGCPWDREQSMASLRKYVLEEACEVIDAIDEAQHESVVEELGDLVLQVVFLGELGRAQGAFGPDDVIRGIVEKLVRRHPHVFGDQQVSNSEEVLTNWEKIKDQEKQRGVLDGVPRSLPALQRAQQLSNRVSRVGFDWPDGQGSRAKVAEELQELDGAIQSGRRQDIEWELGDLLFAIVNLARHLELDAELALRKACDRFGKRFSHVEAQVRERHAGWPRGDDGKPTRGIPLDALDGYWNEAKQEEK